jgi:hypothetical protein
MAKRVNIFSRQLTGIEHRIGYLVLLITYITALIIAFCRKDLMGIGLMGMIVFIGSMVGGSLLSEKGDLSSGEVRRSIAISFVLVFFALLAFGENITISADQKLISKVLDNFWVFIVAIIGFYFGGRSLEKAAENNRQDTSEKPSTDATTP